MQRFWSNQRDSVRIASGKQWLKAKQEAEAKAKAASAATEPYNAHSVLFFKEVAKVANRLVQELKENIVGCNEVILADINNVLTGNESPQKCRDPFDERFEGFGGPRPG